MPAPTRKYAWASVRVYDRGHGDPLCVDPGLGWYDVLAQSYHAGTPTVNSVGIPLLEQIPGVGVCCRAFRVWQDTRKAQFTFPDGGTWEESQISTGKDVYRLHQIDASPSLTAWSARSTYVPPANAQYAFSLILPDSSAEWDFDTYPPFIRIELGGAYGVQFTKEGAYLMRYLGGAWRAVQDLPSPTKGLGYADAEEVFVYVRVLRGQVCVSVDCGRTYTCYAPPDGPATIPAARLIVRGRGGSVTFGVHQLKCFAGSWDSRARALERPRLATTVSFNASRYDLNGGTIDFTDLGSGIGRTAQYRATLTPPTPVGSTPFAWYSTPVLYATHYRVAPTVQVTGNTYSTPFDDTLRRVTVSKPYELDGANASFSFWADAFAENDWDGYRWRKVEIWLGWRLSDDTIESYLAFTGYIEGRAVAWNEDFSKVLVTFQVHNASARFKRKPWTPFLQLPLGGQTLNAAADEILAAHGLNASYRSWHVWGDVEPLAAGSPEDPYELTHAQEYPWETLRRIFEQGGLELGVADDGTLFTVPKDTTTGELARTLYAGDGAADVWERVRSITYRTDYKQCGTAAMVYGTNEAGEQVFGYDVDTVAETDTTSSRFCPWSELWLKELPGTPDAGAVIGHLQSLAAEALRVRDEGDTSLPLDPTIGRRQELEFMGFAGAGVPDETRFVVLTEEHTWECNQGFTSLETSMGIRRLAA